MFYHPLIEMLYFSIFLFLWHLCDIYYKHWNIDIKEVFTPNIFFNIEVSYWEFWVRYYYRKWKITWEIFRIKDFTQEENDYFCEYCYYRDSFHCETSYILQKSIKATPEEIQQFLQDLKKYNNS
jgi:hypothetical protein